MKKYGKKYPITICKNIEESNINQPWSQIFHFLDTRLLTRFSCRVGNVDHRCSHMFTKTRE